MSGAILSSPAANLSFRAAILSLLAAVLSGCLSGSHRRDYDALLADLRGQAGASTRIDGSRGAGAMHLAGGEDAVDLSERLTLRDALDTALRRNPEILTMLRRWEALTERIPQVGSLQDPQLTYLYNMRSIETRAGPKRNELLVSQQLPFPGELGLREEAAIAESSTMREEYRAKAREIARDVATRYHKLAFVYRAIEINERNQDLVRSLEGSAQSRYRAGAVTQQDVIRVQVRRTHLLHRSIALERERRVAETQLNELLGREARAALARPEEPVEGGEVPSLEDLRRQAFASRPELAAVEQGIRRQIARIGLAERSYFPDFTLGLSYIDIEGGTNRAFDEEGKDAFKVLLGVNLPVFTARRAAEVREAEASLEGSRARYLSLRNRIDRQLREAHENLVEARREASLFQDTLLPQTRQNLEAAEAGYEADLVDLLTVIDAQEALEDVELDYERSVQNVRVSREELAWAAGTPPAALDTEFRGGERR